MKATLIFKTRETVTLKSGQTLELYMDCYRLGFKERESIGSFVFSWVVFDPMRTERRVLMDQHRGRPCHLHIGGLETLLEHAPESIDEAVHIFWKKS